MAIQYYIDNHELKSTYGVRVSKSKGLIGRPQLKTPKSVEYADHNGKYVDLSHPKYQERKITLECFIPSSTKAGVVSMANDFLKVLNAPGTHRLEVALDGEKKMCFDVYNSGDSSVVPEWHANKQCGTFTLTLIESNPLKMVFFTEALDEEVVFRIDTDKYLYISWGDGEGEHFPSGGELHHTYQREGEKYIMLSGDIDDVDSDDIDYEGCELIYSEI